MFTKIASIKMRYRTKSGGTDSIMPCMSCAKNIEKKIHLQRPWVFGKQKIKVRE